MLDTIKLILSLLPIIIKAIKEIEAQFPEKGLGQQKLELVKNILEADNAEKITNNWNTIEKTIGYVVKFCNTSGIFNK